MGPMRAVARASRALRTNQWWGHMLGPIVAMACLQIGWRQVPPGEAFPRVGALLWSAITLAAYGYVVNDTSDVEPDRIAGKSNSMARLSPALRVAVIVGFAVLGALPWLLVDLNTPTLVALAGFYVLPILYSVPPMRLKERVLGPLADATNAFLLPALFTTSLFASQGEAQGPAPLMVVGAAMWSLSFGLRAIIQHQIDDAEHDIASGTSTLVLRVGPGRARRVVRQVLLPTELLGLAALAATVATWSWGTVAVGAGYAATFHALRLTGVIDRGIATTTLDNGYWLYWYQIWPAMLVSCGLAAWDPWYVLLIAGIVVLFWPRLRNGLLSFWHSARGELHRQRALRGRVAG